MLTNRAHPSQRSIKDEKIYPSEKIIQKHATSTNPLCPLCCLHRKKVAFRRAKLIICCLIVSFARNEYAESKTPVMKKSNAHFLVLAVLVLISLCSYVYLATRDAKDTEPTYSDSAKEEPVVQDNMKAGKSGKYLLIDVEALKKLATGVRRLLPASSF